MLGENLKNKKIVLGSASPRRQELLKLLAVDFEIRLSNSDEQFNEKLPPEQIAKFLATQKSEALKNTIIKNEILITADTIVAKEDRILNKPNNEKEAVEMLTFLSNGRHQVITGVCISSTEKSIAFSVNTKVFFKKLSSEEINFYIKNYKPFDKAGAYGIQEWIGLIGIEEIQGSYFNVVGLPMQKLYQNLIQFVAD
ncbi:MAG: septum formation protein Maf [Flavobacteriales bacterium TMED123]|nr:MAG: septum formation protein Maf [Flavobacteriales bacterium TMED123]|tara:strand:- start:8168 stop:8758 length:591 start_codon:yes stop_codon:yes gene_type:complete